MENNGPSTPKDSTSEGSDSKSVAAHMGGGGGGAASIAGASSIAESNNNGASHNATHKSPKKRRKVNHVPVRLVPSGLPSLADLLPAVQTSVWSMNFLPPFPPSPTRYIAPWLEPKLAYIAADLCIKRNIGHLCHDEPRDPESKKARSVQGTSVMDESDTRSDVARSTIDQTRAAMRALDQGGAFARSAALGTGNPLQQLVSPTQGIQAGALNSNLNQFAGFNDAFLNNPFHDMHNYHPNYMIPEVSHEFNLLNDFLHNSLLDDSALSPEEASHPLKNNSGSNNNQPSTGDMNAGGYFSGAAAAGASNTLLPPSAVPSGSMGPPGSTDTGSSIPRSGSNVPPISGDKAREYYLQVADPAGLNDLSPDDRMGRLLQAKFDAGLLKPFNYTKGYSRLLTYLDGHVAPASKQKVLRQLDRFRPKFREKVEKLADLDLVYIEVWFERTLMEYDRVFASMAVPACCWRRTGEIFRGNTEMAELLGIEVDRLRDGKISLHQILTEESVVRYWEEFGTIAFDPDHDSLLTACALKHPDDKINTINNCCFSFMIRRDEHKL
ncbi:hypothetical protein MKZ38_007608 [Zalerion maritima]|uniref:ERT1/acuK family PAS domain-containing protein n=1 Tax=Zalerion maritima TaxID=339359 RepID=A0AAD5RZQ1_9PEZI|nr:hypothetical protein MKZ38_007608 [Zalerion maritima]